MGLSENSQPADSDKIEIFNFKDRPSNIYIPNQSGHDFSACEKYGNKVFVTKGIVNRFAVMYIARRWALSLKDSKEHDYILDQSNNLDNHRSSSVWLPSWENKPSDLPK